MRFLEILRIGVRTRAEALRRGRCASGPNKCDAPCPVSLTSHARVAILAAAAIVLPGEGAAQTPPPPFETPWLGYNAGESAYPGNPDPKERDPYGMVAADFDGDGHPDVAVANYDYASPGGTSGESGFAVLFNQGDGSYGPPEHYTISTRGHFDILAADLDGDGAPDLVLPHSGRIGSEIGSTVVIFRNDGAGGFAPAGEHAVQIQPMDVALGDFNADGRLDLVVGSSRYNSTRVAILFGDGSGGFAPQVPLEIGPVPETVETGDFDGDGYDDFAVSALGDLAVVMNDGAGGFRSPVFLSAPGGQEPIVGKIAVADLDGDGAPDLIHGVYSSSGPFSGRDLAVRLGNGDGTFADPAYYDAYYGTSPDGLTVADLDGDGDLDIAACDWSGRTGDGVAVLFNDGTGALGGVRFFPAGQGTQDLAAADVDGDLDLDIVTADRMSLAITVHRNPGDGRFPVLEDLWPTDTSSTLHLALGDVDGDGDLDALVSGESFGTPGALVMNNGDATFGPPVILTHSHEYGRGVSNAKLRDLDGDGDLDLLYNDAHTDYFTGYDFWTALNDGSGNFSQPVEWDLNTCGNGDIDAFDLDNDGDLDVVNAEELGCAGILSANRLFVRLNRGDATFEPAYVVEIGTGPHAIAGGDFNEDGNVDLVTTHWMPYGLRDFINVHLGNGDGTFQEEQVYPVGQGPRWIVVADLDGDGHEDLATANSGADGTGRETITVLFGTGTGGFSGRTDYYAPYSPDLLGATGLAAGDIDGDGDIDLLAATVANGVAVYWNDGGGGFTMPYRLGISWGPWSPVLADMDGDGIADLASLVSLPPSGLGMSLAVQRGLAGGTTSIDAPEGPHSGRVPVWAPVPLQIEPNPLRSHARFTLEVPRAEPVSISVFDPTGRRVAVLHDGRLEAGEHAFELDGSTLPAGVYLVRARGASFAASGRAVILR